MLLSALTDSQAFAPAVRRGEEDWRKLVDEMSDVQKLVHLAYRKTADDEEEWADDIFKNNRKTYTDTLDEEAAAWGCHPPPASLTRGPILKAIHDEADESGRSIVGTFNYDLALEIRRIGRETPTANRHVYAYRLRTWVQERDRWKLPQITTIETFKTVNRAQDDFYRFNDLPQEGAEVVPYVTPNMCPICAEYVAGNPYPSMQELLRQCQLPAHPHCPHYGRVIPARRLTRQECRELWLGE
jgi:hypothetical protein